MKRILMMGIAALASVAMAQEMSLADASGKLDAAAENPATMTSVTKQLSAADQVAFLARVNAAIAALPGSAAEKAAKYLNANAAALKGAAKGNLPALLAEVFATVPPEALTVINERFASDLFNRTASGKAYTDEEFVKFAQNGMSAIQKRTASADNAGVRDTFAILMFLRASNGTPADLADTLVANLADEKTQTLAKNEWIPPALNDKDYEPMLGMSDAGDQPDAAQVLRLAGPQVGVAMLTDLAAGDVLGMGNTSTMFDQSSGLFGVPVFGDDSGLNRIPRTMNKDMRNYGGYHRGDKGGEGSNEKECHRVCEPGGYNCQWICFE